MPPVTRRAEGHNNQLAEIPSSPIIISSSESESESDESLKGTPLSQRRRFRKSTMLATSAAKPSRRRLTLSRSATAAPSKEDSPSRAPLTQTPSVRGRRSRSNLSKSPSVSHSPNPSPSTSNLSLDTPSVLHPSNPQSPTTNQSPSVSNQPPPMVKSNSVAPEVPAQDKTKKTRKLKRSSRVVESSSESDEYEPTGSENDASYRASGKTYAAIQSHKRSKSSQPQSKKSNAENNSTPPSSEPARAATSTSNNHRPRKSTSPSTRSVARARRSVSRDVPVVVRTEPVDDLTEITHNIYEDQPARQLQPVPKEDSSAYDRRIYAGTMATRTRATSKRILMDESTGEPLRVFITYQTKDRLKYALLVKQLTNKDLLTQPRSDSLNLAESDYVTKLSILPLLNTFKFYDVELLQCSANLGYMPSREGYLIYDPEKDKMERRERVVEKVQIIDDDEQPIIKSEPSNDYPAYIRRMDINSKKSTPSISQVNSLTPNIEPASVVLSKPLQSSTKAKTDTPRVQEPQDKVRGAAVSSDTTVNMRKNKQSESRAQLNKLQATRPYSTVDDYTILLALNRYKNNEYQVYNVLFQCLGTLLNRSPTELEHRFRTRYAGKVNNILQFLKSQTIKPLPLQDLFDSIDKYLAHQQFEEKIAQSQPIVTAVGTNPKYSKKNQRAIDETVSLLNYVLPIFAREKLVRNQVFVDFERIYPCRLWASWEARYHELRGAIDAYNAGKLIKVPKYLEKVLKRHLGPSLMGRNSKISRIVRLVDMTKANTDDDTGTNKSDDDIEVLAAVPKRSYWKKHHRTPVSINSQYDPIVIDFSDTETQHTSSFNGEGNNVSGATTSNDKKEDNNNNANNNSGFNDPNSSSGSNSSSKVGSANNTRSTSISATLVEDVSFNSNNTSTGSSAKLTTDTIMSDSVKATPRINLKHSQLPLSQSPSTFPSQPLSKNVTSQQTTTL